LSVGGRAAGIPVEGLSSERRGGDYQQNQAL